MELSIGDDEFPPDIDKFQDSDIEIRGEIEILKLDLINYQHSLWQAWWEKYSYLLPTKAEAELKKIFETKTIKLFFLNLVKIF